MNSEKATAVSPSSSPRARGPSVLDLLRGAATPTNSGQARRTDREQKTTRPLRKEKHRKGANSLSARHRGSVRACVRTQS